MLFANSLVRQAPSRKIAIKLFRHLEGHVCTGSFIKRLECWPMMEQYSWVYFHVWALRRAAARTGPMLLGRNLDICMEEFTREHAQEYEDYFDLNVYHELSRRRNTLSYSLSDFYDNQFAGKPLEQIIEEDLFAEERLQGTEEQQKVEGAEGDAMDRSQEDHKLIKSVQYIQKVMELTERVGALETDLSMWRHL